MTRARLPGAFGAAERVARVGGDSFRLLGSLLDDESLTQIGTHVGRVGERMPEIRKKMQEDGPKAVGQVAEGAANWLFGMLDEETKP